MPTVKSAADLDKMILVCPDGGFGSWYFDSPVDEHYKYETYIANELVGWIDKHYKTITDRSGRAITGLSMVATVHCISLSNIRMYLGRRVAPAEEWIYVRIRTTGILP